MSDQPAIAAGNNMPAVDVFIERAVLGLVRRRGLRSVCDYGCGDGTLLKRLDQKTAHRLRLTGVDYFSRGKRWRKEWALPATSPAGNMVFVDRDAKAFQQMSGGKGLFDLVTSVCALHHFRHPCAELRNIQALLKPGGFAVVADWDFEVATASGMVKNLYSFLSESFHAFNGKYHRHHYTPQQALDLFLATKFRIIKSRTVRFIDAAAREDATKSALCTLAGMKRANQKTTSPVLKEYFKKEFGIIEQLVKNHGINYPSLYVIIAQL